MGKKFIINLPEDTQWVQWRCKSIRYGWTDVNFGAIEDLTPYTEPDLERVRKEAYEEGKKQAKVQAELDVSHDIEKVARENYKAGLSDAWEAAKKVSHCALWDDYRTDTGKLSVYTGDVLDYYTASEAIEKLKAYEQKQDAIQIGDEVAFQHDDGRPDTVVVVTYIGEDGFIDGMDGRGTQYAHKNPKRWAKTGRHFPEIATVLDKMRENA